MELTEVFGSNVFNDKVMKERLPKDAYKAMKETIDKGRRSAADVADVVANAMKDWAHREGGHALHPLVPAADRASPPRSTTPSSRRPPTAA